jgi:hypothetical protein
MLKQQTRPPQHTTRYQPVEELPLHEEKRERRSTDRSEPLDPSEEKHALQEQKDWPFLRGAEADLKLLEKNYAKRWRHRDTVLGIVNALKRTIDDVKRHGHDEALFATYKTCRDIARQLYWADDVYAIFNDTLDDLDREPLRRKRQLSDPGLIAENDRIRRLIIAKEQSISILEESNQALQRSIRANKHTIKQKNLRIAELGGSDDPSPPPSPQNSPRSSPQSELFQ